MLFQLNPVKPALQRQLEADQHAWSRQLQRETEGSFSREEIESFRMHGLFGEIPDNDTAPVKIGVR
jgi:hypothetical protein